MKKEDKSIIIDQIANTLKEYSCFYLAETAGLDAEKTSALRRECFKNDIKLMVVKNTLLHKALETLEGDYSEIYGALKGSTSILFSNVGNAPAKLLKSMIKKDQALPRFKAAYVEETIYVGEDQLEALSNIKSKNELIADVIAMLESPLQGVISGLDAGTTIHGLLDAIEEKNA